MHFIPFKLQNKSKRQNEVINLNKMKVKEKELVKKIVLHHKQFQNTSLLHQGLGAFSGSPL